MSRKSRKGGKSRRTRLIRIGIGIVALVALLGIGGQAYLKNEDRKYEKFLAAGAGINSFFGSFARLGPVTDS